jgi:translation initiation factor eIF-2B subunit alpha
MIVQRYLAIAKEYPDMSAPIIAVKVLIETVRFSSHSTYQELIQTLNEQSFLLKDLSIATLTGTRLFLRFVNRQQIVDFNSWKVDIISIADQMVSNSLQNRIAAATHGTKFVKEGCTILIHGYSRPVLLLLKLASSTKRFRVIVSKSLPSNQGLAILI